MNHKAGEALWWWLAVIVTGIMIGRLIAEGGYAAIIGVVVFLLIFTYSMWKFHQ